MIKLFSLLTAAAQGPDLPPAASGTAPQSGLFASLLSLLRSEDETAPTPPANSDKTSAAIAARFAQAEERLADPDLTNDELAELVAPLISDLAQILAAAPERLSELRAAMPEPTAAQAEEPDAPVPWRALAEAVPALRQGLLGAVPVTDAETDRPAALPELVARIVAEATALTRPHVDNGTIPRNVAPEVEARSSTPVSVIERPATEATEIPAATAKAAQPDVKRPADQAAKPSDQAPPPLPAPSSSAPAGPEAVPETPLVRAETLAQPQTTLATEPAPQSAAARPEITVPPAAPERRAAAPVSPRGATPPAAPVTTLQPERDAPRGMSAPAAIDAEAVPLPVTPVSLGEAEDIVSVAAGRTEPIKAYRVGASATAMASVHAAAPAQAPLELTAAPLRAAANTVEATLPTQLTAPPPSLPMSVAAPPAPAETAQPPRPAPPLPSSEQILGQVRAQLGQDGQIRVALKPEGLGKVEIELTPDDNGHLRVTVRAEQSSVLSLLRADRDGLLNLLRDGGHQVDTRGLSFSDLGTRDPGQGQTQGQRPAPFSGAFGGADTDDAGDPSPETQHHTARPQAGGVDIQV
ncbi:flagellar hook-length control protein FliK [Salipiger abyssi]|uniref:flagellar hook-length control protein FliK n=1 Tax=Salipiger abyssi TaxID=1250539 RepID=UPI001A8DA6EF|nr:flagellar hook-length control protein FliK [Salipiger abyssi]MBN9887134.1 flagellar hook-length control protein FliK [Salipiger abyssi]